MGHFLRSEAIGRPGRAAADSRRIARDENDPVPSRSGLRYSLRGSMATKRPASSSRSPPSADSQDHQRLAWDSPAKRSMGDIDSRGRVQPPMDFPNACRSSRKSRRRRSTSLRNLHLDLVNRASLLRQAHPAELDRLANEVVDVLRAEHLGHSFGRVIAFDRKHRHQMSLNWASHIRPGGFRSTRRSGPAPPGRWSSARRLDRSRRSPGNRIRSRRCSRCGRTCPTGPCRPA